jgi:hypothetical protein
MIAVLAALVPGTWAGVRLWPRTLEFRSPTLLFPVWNRTGAHETLRIPDRCLISEISVHDDELLAYLVFQYLRGVRAFDGAEVLLTYRRSPAGLVYPIELRLDDNLFTTVPVLESAKAHGLIVSAS